MGNIDTSYCKTDADCYTAAMTTAADKAKACCARSEIIKLDASKPDHATNMAITKSSAIGFKDGTLGETIKNCIDDYAITFAPEYYKDNVTVDDSAFPKSGIWFKTYCDGGETLAFVGKLAAATGIAYMSLY